MAKTPPPPQEKTVALPVLLREAKKKAKNLPLRSMVRSLSGSSMERLSKMIGTRGNYLARRLQSGDVPVSVLVCLSWALHRNMLDHYLEMLPEDCRETALTRQLREEIDALKTAAEAEKKETAAWREKFEYADGLLRAVRVSNA